MADPNTLQLDLREAIKVSVLKVCEKHGLDETKINYQLNLNASYEIEDEIVTNKE